MRKPGWNSSVTAAPPDHGAPLEHGDLESGRGKVGRAHQPVVSPADDQGVAARAAARRAQPWLQPRAGGCGKPLSGISLRMCRPKLFRHASPSPSGPEV